MERSSLTTIAVLVVAFVVGVGAVLLLTGGDDSKPTASVPPTVPSLTLPPGVTLPTTTTPTSPKKTTTTKTTRTQPKAQPIRTQAVAPPHEVSPAVLKKRAEARARRLEAAGERKCADIGQPDAGVQNLTVKGVSCKSAKDIIYATKGRRGFQCDIVGESFSGTPAVEYACTRAADKAKINYTAVG
jgi:hypothetical protein